MSDVAGSKKLIMQFDKLQGSKREFMNILNSVNKSIVQANAKLLCSVNNGELRDSITSDIKDEGGFIQAETFTNKKQGIFVEFGTGPIGEQNHDGISPEVTPSYSQHGWGIPADKVDASDAEQYKWPKRTYKGKEYYMTSGQPARPFLYPALKNNEKHVKRRVGELMQQRIIKKGVK